jgi:hypothetical protein
MDPTKSEVPPVAPRGRLRHLPHAPGAGGPPARPLETFCRVSQRGGIEGTARFLRAAKTYYTVLNDDPSRMPVAVVLPCSLTESKLAPSRQLER